MDTMSPLPIFAAMTLVPVPVLLFAGLAGGGWVWTALLLMAILVAVLDDAIGFVLPSTKGEEFPAANGLSLTLALAHFVILVSTVGALGGDHLTAAEKFALFLASGMWLGQVSNSNAHELIHRSGRGLRRIGVAIYVSLLFGHHASAHLHVHHVMVGTRNDPNTARRDETLYGFAKRAWKGSFRAGWQIETERRRRAGRPIWQHPYCGYLGGAILCIGAVGGALGWQSLLAYLLLAAFSQFQLMMSDYVQHYGLTRHLSSAGKPEPVAARHSWNSPHWASSALMLNAPRHSDHHARPTRPYPALTLTDGPMLPRSLPEMACIALAPRFWRKVMHPRLDKYEATWK